MKKQAKAKRPSKTKSEKLASKDPDQHNIERQFAAQHVVQGMLEGVHNSFFVFDQDEGEEGYGSCELEGVTDARDKEGRGGAWVSVRIYVPNIDIDTEINR